MAASPHTLSSRFLTGIARAVGHDFGRVLFLTRATLWFRLAATLGALGEVGWAPVGGCDLGVAFSDEATGLGFSVALCLWLYMLSPFQSPGGAVSSVSFGFHRVEAGDRGRSRILGLHESFEISEPPCLATGM